MHKSGWLAAILLGMLAAAVALAFAGWDAIAIVGVLTAVGSVAAPLLSLMSKTDELGTKTDELGVKTDELGKQTTEVHEIVNSQRTADTQYRQQLAASLRDHDIVVPLDATGGTD